MLVNRSERTGMPTQRCRVRVMAREPIGSRLLGRPVVLGVEDGRLLPETSLHFQSYHFAAPVGEGRRESVYHPRPYRVTADRLLVGERAELELHRPLEVLKPRRLGRGVVEQEYRRVR